MKVCSVKEFKNIANVRFLGIMFERLCTNFTQAYFETGLHMTLVVFVLIRSYMR